MPNALIAPGGVVDPRRRPLTPQDYDLIQAYRGRPVSLDVLGPPPSTLEMAGALAPMAGAAVMAPSLPLALATIPAYHLATSGALRDLPSIPTLPGEPWATLSDFVLGIDVTGRGGGPGASNRAAVIRRPSPGWKSTLKGLVEAKLPAKATPEQLEAIARYAPKEEVQYVNLSDLAGGPLRKEDVLRTIEQRNVPLEETLRTEGDVKYRSRSTPGGEDYRELLLTLPNEITKRIAEIDAERDAIARNPAVRPEARARYDALEAEKTALQRQMTQYTSSHWPGEPNVLAHTRLNTFLDPQGKKVLLVDEIQSDWHQAGREKGYHRVPDKSKITVKRVGEGDNAYWESFDQYGDMITRHPGIMNEQQALKDAQVFADLPSGRPPDAPFKREWHELAFKRALREAAETGAEKLAWTTGEQQSQRYDLSKHIGELQWDPGGEWLYAKDPAGNRVINERVSRDELDNYVGKELADKLREQADDSYRYSREDYSIEPVETAEGDTVYEVRDSMGDRITDATFENRREAEGFIDWEVEENNRQIPSATLRGLDLKVGGEGMKGFYDQILPQFANKYLKPFGIKTGETQLPTGVKPEQGFEIVNTRNGQVVGHASTAAEAAEIAQSRTLQHGIEHEVYPKQEAFHSITITPELREFLMRGQPLFGSKK